MSADALKVIRDYKQEIKGKTTKEKIERTFTDEIIIGICAPIGSLKDKVITEIKKQLIDSYNYEVQIISLSKLIIDHSKKDVELLPGKTTAFSELKHKINEGNNLRKRYKNLSVLAELAIKEINLDRNNFFSVGGVLPEVTDLQSRRKCYIIDSLKKKEELHLFRSIYKDLFYSFSIFSPKSERHLKLNNYGLSNPEIKELMGIDDLEINEFGQDVRNTFIEGDFFLRVSENSQEKLPKKIERYINIIFESDVVTPFNHEYAMYVAKSAAGNSACLSRQVGASIMSKEGVILSKGWNDVPKFGGNLYNEIDGENDKRCFTDGYCRNDKTKDRLTKDIIELVKTVIKDDVIDPIKGSLKKDITDSKFDDDYLGKIFDDRITEVIPKLNGIIRNSRIKDLIEFSRSVHAEMHAIITGSQICGEKIRGSILFTTTYPCHNCARHIIAAGITEVYFIEPYVKSLGLELHDDAITENEIDDKKVKLLVYDGVAPRRYLEFFSKNRDRKNKNGEKINYDLTKIAPKFKMTLQALSTLEQQAIHSLSEAGILIQTENEQKDLQ